MKKMTLLPVAILVVALCSCALFHQHAWNEATCTEPKTCSSCGATEGDALGHTWVEATCTEPKTCSVCGATEGEALGHAWAEATCVAPSICSRCGITEGVSLGHTKESDPAAAPTCTESGLTEGAHCSVCGEVLVPQQTVPALGHDWASATFFDPKSCRVCGVTEGEALGSQLFINALNPEKSSESREASPEARTGGEEAFTPVQKKVRITGSAHGIDQETEDIINNSYILLTVNNEEKNAARIGIEAVLNGSKPLNILFTVDETGLGLALPGITEEYYKVDYDTLGRLLSEYTSLSTMLSSTQLTAESAEKDRDLLLKYEKILFGMANGHNTTETAGEYTLTGLGKVQNCRVIVCRPSASDWQKTLGTILMMVRSDTELMNQIVRQYLSQQQVDSGSREEYEQMVRDMIQEWIAAALMEVPSIAKELEGTTLEVAYQETRVYAIKLSLRSGMAIAYESFGEAQTGRTDALFLYEDEEPTLLAMNELEQHTRRVTGRFSIPLEEIQVSYIFGKTENEQPIFDILFSIDDTTVRIALEETDGDTVFAVDYGDIGSAVSIQAVITEGDEKLAVPEGPATVLKTEEEIQTALEKISEDIYKAELFGHVWQEATCTEPKTCTICGATEGEALGHTWQEATCTESKTCTVCGATEGEALGHTDIRETMAVDNLSAIRIVKSVCGVCGKEIDRKEEQIQTFIQDKAFSFTPIEFVARLQFDWNDQNNDMAVTFKYCIYEEYLIFDCYYEDDLWVGWGLFYDKNGIAIKESSVDTAVYAIRIITGPVEGVNEDALLGLYGRMIRCAVSAVDPSIRDVDLYFEPIITGEYWPGKKDLNGLQYTCFQDEDSASYKFDIDIAQ